MPVEVTHQRTVPAPPQQVWEFIADPANRAAAISAVEDYDDADGPRATWHVELPVPLVAQTVAVDTTETDRHPPEYVRFVGSAPGLDVTGEHTLPPIDGGTQLHNRFVVASTVLIFSSIW